MILQSLDVPEPSQRVEQLVLRRRVLRGARGEHGQRDVKAERGQDQVRVAGERLQKLKER